MKKKVDIKKHSTEKETELENKFWKFGQPETKETHFCKFYWIESDCGQKGKKRGSFKLINKIIIVILLNDGIDVHVQLHIYK